MSSKKLLQLDHLKFIDIAGKRCINLTLLAESFGKKPQAYFKTAGFQTWVKVVNQTREDDKKTDLEIIDPDNCFFILKKDNKAVYYTWHYTLASDFVRYCSRAWAFANCIKIAELWNNPNKYDSQLESDVISNAVIQNVVDNIDFNELFGVDINDLFEED